MCGSVTLTRVGPGSSVHVYGMCVYPDVCTISVCLHMHVHGCGGEGSGEGAAVPWSPCCSLGRNNTA